VSHFFRAFRHRHYQLFFTGQLMSFTGTWMQSVAQSWLVYRLTGSSALLGVTAFCSQIPVFVLAPLAGTVADRGNRHRIMVVTQSVSMVLASPGLLTITGRVQVWHVLVLASGLGIVNAFDIPARQSFVVTMVGREDLMNAIALNSSLVNGARVVGPAVAGVLVAAVGEAWCFLIHAISYVAVIAALLMMRAEGPRSAMSFSFRDTVEGFRFVARTAPVQALLLLLGIISIAGMPYRADADLRRFDSVAAPRPRYLMASGWAHWEAPGWRRGAACVDWPMGSVSAASFGITLACFRCRGTSGSRRR
jgi:MFS family permease